MNNHLRNMYLYFLASTAAVLLLGIGTSITGSWILAAVAAALVAGSAIVGGILGTMRMRVFFGLMQTGRVLQYASFTLSTYVGLLLCGWLFGSTLSLGSPLLSAFAIFALAFGPATLVGEVQVRGRTWLPVRRM